MSETGYIKVGEVAKRAGVSTRTVRYYEEMGLIEPAARSRGGFRLYSGDDLKRLRVIEELKLLEFTLADIRSFLQLRRASDTGAESARAVEEWLKVEVERLDFLLDKYQTMKDDMARALEVLKSCALCDKKPSPETCFVCPAVQEAGEVPRILAAMM